MKKFPLVSIILPVYNPNIDYLSQAIDSVFSQTYSNWELVITDNASNEETKCYLQTYKNNPRVTLIFNTTNLGLFANLNQAIRKSNGHFILILCDDDILLNEAIQGSVEILARCEEAEFLLSCPQVIDENGNPCLAENQNRSSALYRIWLQDNKYQVFPPQIMLPLLLREAGDVNANLTGFFLTRRLFNNIGGFTEHWSQVPDWELVYRIAKDNPIILSQIPRTIIRRHRNTLSGANFKNFTNSFEVLEMIKILLADSYLSQLKDSKKWATHVIQFHLWFALKALLKGKWRNSSKVIQEIHNIVGIYPALLAMIQYLPERWKIYRYQSFPLESSVEMWDDLTKNVRQAKQSGV
jgi:glycosyltransferase involved in cell wall biosynthesis